MVPNLPPYSRGGEIIRILILPGDLSVYYYEPWYLHPYGAATVTSSGTAVDADRNAFVIDEHQAPALFKTATIATGSVDANIAP